MAAAEPWRAPGGSAAGRPRVVGPQSAANVDEDDFVTMDAAVEGGGAADGAAAPLLLEELEEAPPVACLESTGEADVEEDAAGAPQGDVGGGDGGEAAAAATGAGSARRGPTWGHNRVTRVVREFTGTQGPRIRMAGARGRASWTPLAVWRKFVPLAVLRLIADETNRYADQVARSPRHAFVRAGRPWPPVFIRRWEELRVPELKAFLGLCYCFGALEVPAARHYWRTNAWMFQFPHIRAIMSRQRFEDIRRCLHFFNNEDGDFRDRDPFYKVRPLLDSLFHASKKNYQPGQNLAVDEQMQTCNNRTCPEGFHPPRKKTNGIKIWSICESGTGYMVSFRIARRKRQKIHDVVLSMVGDLECLNHRLHMDNLFSTPSLFEELLCLQQYACGTWRSNYYMPVDLKPKNNKRLPKGEFIWLMTASGLLGVAWHDSKVCNFLSNFHGPDTGYVMRRERGRSERKRVEAPQVAVDYNAYMGAVDEMDSLRARYTTARPCMRWYVSLFYWWLDVAAIQSLVLYRYVRKECTHLQFIAELVNELSLEHAGEEALQIPQKRKRRRMGAPPSPARPYRNTHWPLKTDKRRNCHYCYHKHQKKQSQVSVKCEGCDRYLHINCFKPFHEEQAARHRRVAPS